MGWLVPGRDPAEVRHGSEFWVGPSEAVERLVASEGALLAYLKCYSRLVRLGLLHI